MQMMKFLSIDFLVKYLILYRERRVQLLLTLVESFVSNVKRIKFRRSKIR